MTRAGFEVGKDEKHAVAVDTNDAWGNVKVSVDGKEIISKRMSRRDPSLRFSIGSKEQHQIEVIVKWPFLGNARVELFVDGIQHGRA